MAFVPGPTASRASGGTVVFSPGWRNQPGQKEGLLSRLVSPTGTKLLGPLIPFPLPPPEPFNSLVLAVLGSGERGVLAHFFTTFHALEIEKMCS